MSCNTYITFKINCSRICNTRYVHPHHLLDTQINFAIVIYTSEPNETYRSKISPSDSTHSNKSRDVDEGIGESETEVRDSPLNGAGDATTPLIVGYSSSDHQSKSLSDTGKESSQSTLSSVQTTTSSSSCSEKNSPDDLQAAHIAEKIKEFSGGGTVNESGDQGVAGGPSGLMDTVEAVESQDGGGGAAGNSATGTYILVFSNLQLTKRKQLSCYSRNNWSW